MFCVKGKIKIGLRKGEDKENQLAVGTPTALAQRTTQRSTRNVRVFVRYAYKPPTGKVGSSTLFELRPPHCYRAV